MHRPLPKWLTTGEQIPLGAMIVSVCSWPDPASYRDVVSRCALPIRLSVLDVLLNEVGARVRRVGARRVRCVVCDGCRCAAITARLPGGLIGIGTPQCRDDGRCGAHGASRHAAPIYLPNEMELTPKPVRELLNEAFLA